MGVRGLNKIFSGKLARQRQKRIERERGREKGVRVHYRDRRQRKRHVQNVQESGDLES